MYTIIKGTDGKFHCEGRIQDGTERWTEDDLETAIKSMKRHAEIMNGTKIKRRHIRLVEPVQVVKTEYVEIPMPKKPGRVT